MDTHKFTLYGGAKGGGKSYILRWAIIRQLIKWAKEGHPNVRGVLFCEDYPALADRQVSKIKIEFPEWLGTLSGSQVDGLSFKLKPQFGGGILALRNLDNPSKYASSEFAICAVDEITKNHKETIDQLRSIIRWPGIEDTKFIAGTNPGDIGHEWVKKMFIDKILGPEDPLPEQIAFVKSLPTDNPHNAASYLAELKRLPEKLRKAYWEGNWDVFEGQYFTEWDREQHIIEPFSMPETWFRFRSIDPSGRSGTTSCHWYATGPDGEVYCYKEYFEKDKDIDEHAKNIRRMSEDENGVSEDYRYTIIDSAAFAKAGYSETAAEIFERYGVTGLIPAAKERVIGWNAVHTFLRWDDRTKPKLRIFSTCPALIREIPLAIHDENKPEDINTDYIGAEHWDALDDLRYFLRTIREQRSPAPMNPVQRRIAQLMAQHNDTGFNYQYKRV